MRILKVIGNIIVFILLTVLTQVGGVVYLISFSTHRFINKKYRNKILGGGVKFISFLVLYSIITFFIVPAIAKPFGRVPLPVIQKDNLQPLNFLTCFLNRHYVQPQMEQTVIEAAKQMNSKFPGTVVNYLDANFPFFNNFPMVPHLSHNDGKKLDLAFCYIDNKTGKASNETPSVIGYGISEEPRSTEVNTANNCIEKGYWQYNLLMKIIPQGNKQFFTFDSTRTKALVKLFISAPPVEKIFIEPHLKTRIKLSGNKVRFHGCQAVRHDDHLHIQVK